MAYQNLLTQLKDGIFYITINRESKLNALNIATIEEINQVFTEVYDNKDIKGVILTGAGSKAFVAGADIAEIAQLNETQARKFAENGQAIFEKIENCPKPVLAAVNGFALGGGCELAMACHLRFAADNAKFGQPEINLGIIPGYGGTQRLTQYLGKTKAMELTLTGDMFSAQEALAWGLLNYVYPQAELLEKAEAFMQKLTTKAPIAVAQIISSINAFYGLENGYQIEANAFANCCRSQDFKEGTSAFLEKRKPHFQGK
jgi:enoyl-CoA hydratase